MHSTRVVLMVLFAASCGADRVEPGKNSDAPVPDGPGGGGGEGDLGVNRSGTRIKLKIVKSSDGAKVFRGTFDSERNEDCGFGLASDGTTRCLPTAGSITQDYFMDSACTIPAVLAFSCLEAPKYVAFPPPSTCGVPVTVGPRMFARGTPSATGFNKQGANCVLQANPGNQFSFFGSTGAEISPTEFVAATLEIE